MFVNKKEICKFEADNKNMYFSTQFCLRSANEKFGAIEFREVAFKESVYDFQATTVLLINLAYYTFTSI